MPRRHAIASVVFSIINTIWKQIKCNRNNPSKHQGSTDEAHFWVLPLPSSQGPFEEGTVIIPFYRPGGWGTLMLLASTTKWQSSPKSLLLLATPFFLPSDRFRHGAEALLWTEWMDVSFLCSAGCLSGMWEDEIWGQLIRDTKACKNGGLMERH